MANKAVVLGSLYLATSATACFPNRSANSDSMIQNLPEILQTAEGIRAQKRALERIKQQQYALPYNGNHEFIARDLVIDEDGTEHTRFVRKFKGLDVIGGDFMTHVAPGELDAHIVVPLKTSIDVNTQGQISEEEAKQVAQRTFKGTPAIFRGSKQVVFNGRNESVLAWEITYSGKKRNGDPSEQKIYINAQTGKALDSRETVHAIAATGKTLYSGNVALEVQKKNTLYQLLDTTRGRQVTSDLGGSEDFFGTQPNQPPVTNPTTTFGDNTPANIKTLAADAQFGASASWDYFLKVHNRKGVANDGKGVRSNVNYGTSVANAFWYPGCFCLTYGSGDGLFVKPVVSLDVAVHEFSHGVTEYTAGLRYEGESGGLNEATSDIFAALAEYHFNLKSDPPDYLVGENIVVPGVFPNNSLRTMYKPSLDGQSPDCYSPDVEFLDVHFSSAIANHFFYLLAEGSKPAQLPESPTCNNSTITGIGRIQAGKIWYRALSLYMFTGSNYAHAKYATMRAAQDLFGATSKEAKAVTAAWAGVNVLNTAPQLEKIADVVRKDVKPFQTVLNVVDADSPINCTKNIEVKLSNPKVLADKGIKVSGKAPKCVIRYTPNPKTKGSTKVTLTASDESLSTSTDFSITINSPVTRK